MSDVIRSSNGDTALANEKLLNLGVNMGEKMVNEFLAASNNDPCYSLKDVADKVSKVRFT